eukprot:gene9306-10270_t
MIKSRSLFFNIFGDSGAAYIYALGVCVIAGKQIVNWHLANKRKKASSKKGAPTIIERLVSVVPGLSSLVAPFVGGHSSVGGKSASHSQPEGGVSVASGSVPASPGKVFVKSSPAKVAPAIETRPTESTD